MKSMQMKKKQAGLTLMEAIIGLAILAIVISGALALFASADSTQKSTDMVRDLSSLRTSTRQMWQGTGSYGTGNLHTTLHTAKKIPSTLKVDTGTSPYTISHAVNNGTITVTGNTGTFTITVTNLPEDVCTGLVGANAGNGWTSVTVQGTAVTLPTTPASAATACGGSGANTVVLTSN